jgi:hypothetical protein
MAQVVECLPIDCEALSSNPSTGKKKKKDRKKKKTNHVPEFLHKVTWILREFT